MMSSQLLVSQVLLFGGELSLVQLGARHVQRVQEARRQPRAQQPPPGRRVQQERL